MILFLQRHSIIRLLLHLDLFIRAEVIYVYGKERNFSVFDAVGLSARLGGWFFSLLGFARKIQTIDSELFSPALWQANYESIEIALRFEEEVRRDSSYQFLLGYLGADPALIRYYQARIALYVSRFLHMTNLIEALSRGVRLRALIGHEEFAGLACSSQMHRRVRHLLPLRTRWLGAASRLVHGACYRLQWLLLPLVRFLAIQHRVRFRRLAPRNYRAMMQIVWGVPQDTQLNGVDLKTPKDDFYLYSGGLQRGEVLHYYDGSWKFSEEFRSQCNRYMDANGFAWADVNDAPPSLSHLGRLLALQARLLVHSLRNGFGLADSSGIQNISARGLWEALKRELELEHFDWRVVFDRTDYNPRHIIDTILLERKGNRTVGLHHCASPYDSPQIAFVHYSKYIALGEMFTKPYRGWWPDRMIARIGRINIDWTVRARRDHLALLERFEQRHGPYAHRALLMLPGDVYYLFPSRWQELENALSRFVESDLDVALIVRFKSMKEIQKSSNLRRIWNLCQIDRRLVIDQDGFSSYELMCLSHLVLTPNCSSSINEAVALETPVFTFDMHGRTPLVLGGYGKDFILRKGSEIFDRLQSLPKGFGHYDVDFDRLRKDANFTYDGGNHDRIRSLIAALSLEHDSRNGGIKQPEALEHMIGE